MKNEWLCFLQILFPMFAGGLLLIRQLFRSQKSRNLFVFVSMCISAGFTIASCVFVSGEFSLFRITETLNLVFRADLLSKLFSCMVAVVWLLVSVYAFRYLKGTGKTAVFFCAYCVTLGILQGLALSGNLVTFYLFYEWMTIMTVPLVVQLQTKEAIRAGRKYLFYSVAGASLSFIGMLLLSSCTSSLSFQGGLLKNAETSTVLIGALLLICGFGTKAGMFPMHGWLPVAHPAAPAPASAVLSGIITKAGVLGIVRVVYFVIGAEYLTGTYVQTVFIVLTLLTIVMGSMLAYKEKVLKKRLAYSTISQVSYILLGVASLTTAGLAAGLLHMVYHSVIKSALFLFAGTAIHETKKERVPDFKGIGRKMPVTLACFTLASLALIGIPPFSGFVSKWYLAMAAMNAFEGAAAFIAPAVLLFSALLTAGYLLPITADGFFPGKDFVPENLPEEDKTKSREGGIFLLLPLLLFSAAALLLGVFSNPIYALTSEIASFVTGLPL